MSFPFRIFILFSAVILAVSAGTAVAGDKQITDFSDASTDYILSDDTTIKANASTGEAKSITVSGATVEFEKGAVVVIAGDSDTSTTEVTIEGGSTLVLNWDGNPMDTTNTGGIFPDTSSTGPLDVLVDSGTIQFQIPSNVTPVRSWFIDAYNIHIGSGDAVADIAANLTVAARSIDDLDSGTATGGGLTKTGEGTLVIGTNGSETLSNPALNITDKLTVNQGTLILGDREAAGDPSASAYHGSAYLYTAGSVVVGGGGDPNKTAVLDITHKSLLRINNTTDSSTNYDDIIVGTGGTLRVATTTGTGIYKGDDTTPPTNPDQLYMTVDGGKIEIYKGDASFLGADSINTNVGSGGATIDIAENVTFQSGTVSGSGNVEKTGKGTYKIGGTTGLSQNLFTVSEGQVDFLQDMSIGGLVLKDGTAATAADKVTVTVLEIEKNAGFTAAGNQDQTFNQITNAGTYTGNGKNVTITSGNSKITGTMTGIGKLTIDGGILNIGAQGNTDPTISAEEMTLISGAKILVINENNDDLSDKKLIQLKDETTAENFVKELNNGQTALYKYEWDNKNSKFVYNKSADILNVQTWLKTEDKGNAHEIGLLYDNLAVKYPVFEEWLLGLSESQLTTAVREGLVGELAGNAMRAAMSHPYRSVFRHLDSVSPLRFPFGSSVRGQAPFREGFHVWFNPYGSLETTKDDDTTYDGYDITRAGFLFGADVDLYNAAVAGLVFGYGRPSVKSALGKMDVDDFTFGAYLRLPSFAGITANFMVGGGSQSYLYKNSSGKTDFNGKSVSMSFELNRSFAGPNFEWIPLLALDYQSVSADSFLSPVANLGAVSVSPDDLNSAMFRIGLIGKYWRLRTRLQYSCQIAGEDSVLSPTTFYGAAGDIPAAGVRSAKWSKNWFDVGVGGTVLYTQHWRIFADYDFGVGGDTVSHLGSLNTVLTW